MASKREKQNTKKKHYDGAILSCAAINGVYIFDGLLISAFGL